MPTTRTFSTAIGIVMLLAAATGTSAAARHVSRPAARHGVLHVWATPGKGAVDKILLTGVIGDYGTATAETKSGNVDVNGSYELVKLRHGSFKVNDVAFTKKAAQFTPTTNATTCTAWGTIRARVSLFDGSGAYRDISGTVDVADSFGELLPRYASGPRKGRCNFSPNAAPLDMFNGPITGSGDITA